MARKYTSFLKSLERTYEPLWHLIRENTLQQGRWIKQLRWGLNMSRRQLGERMGISGRTVQDLERREEEEKVTLATLRRAANALDLDLFYMFVPKNEERTDKPLQAIIERQARKVAEEIAGRTSTSMKLEEQGIDKRAHLENIDELTTKLSIELPSSLWD